MADLRCTEDHFYNDVRDHEMTILADEGVCRTLRFRSPKTSIAYFYITTWPGHLCISGDMGDWVFARTRDMFSFFRMDDEAQGRAARRGETLCINPSYWEEKLQAVEKHRGAREFSSDLFREKIIDRYREWRQSHSPDPDVSHDLRGDLRSLVLYHADDEHEAYRAAHDFEFRNGKYCFTLDDFGACERHSFRYIWACYAIVWGIWHYDQRNEYVTFWRSAA